MRLFKTRDNKNVRLPVSFAISLLEVLANQPYRPVIQIFATDVSEIAIDKARLGIYLPSQVAEVSPKRLQRFFTPIEGGYQINKTVRELCIFARQNLISDPPFFQMDLISCRNVLIYFGPLLQKKVLPMLHYGLKSIGFLMLGSSETVGEFSSLFYLLDRKHKVYVKQPSFPLTSLDLGSTAPVEGTAPLLPARSNTRLKEVNLAQAADQVILNQYAPVGVVVNAQLEIIQFRGQTGAYLEPSPGQASLNVLSMVKEELRLELRTAIYQARQEGKAASQEEISLMSGEGQRQVRIDVVPIKLNPTSDPYFLILFEGVSVPLAIRPDTQSVSSEQSTQRQKSQEQTEILRLEQELTTTRAYLRSIIEEQQAMNEDLRAANEEILSSNEELQSTNEELQTAKEEIQATNEELSTINDELYRRNVETMSVSNDFQNLLGSINIPILMLEGDLRIRRFTPTAAPLFNLIPTDIGRPLSDIKHNLTITDLEAQIRDVINTLHLKTQEVQDQAGHWYDLRIRPYRTLDNRIDGAVVVLVEIDALNRNTAQLLEVRDYAETIVQTVQESLVVLDTNLRVVMANQRFYETFQISQEERERCRILDLETFQLSPGEAEQCQIFDLGNGQWNIPSLRSRLEALSPDNPQIENFQINHEFEQVGQKTMGFNARRVCRANGTIQDLRDRPL
ncbi:MAG: PAS domain-containing protein [Oscillatoriales cyanobacterium RM2_1_1]|nr:PAS domain-containing protein [Oscillatoriales cyanobacterium SM2_3_0]NJO47313.1 PAS domain-containing protein [Oscillatoriales cyanobacterium RM2_1_1]